MTSLYPNGFPSNGPEKNFFLQIREKEPSISLPKAMIFGISVSLIATGTLIAIASLLSLVIN